MTDRLLLLAVLLLAFLGTPRIKTTFARTATTSAETAQNSDASLSSFQGIVESDFNLKTTQPTIEGPLGRRMIGHFGNGKAQISLDSFDGLVRLTKVPPSKMEACK